MPNPRDEAKERLRKALQEFRWASCELMLAWTDIEFGGDEFGTESYPFANCFGEVTDSIIDWTDAFREELENDVG